MRRLISASSQIEDHSSLPNSATLDPPNPQIAQVPQSLNPLIPQSLKSLNPSFRSAKNWSSASH